MSRIQEAARLARRVPGVRRLVESGDDSRRATRIAASGLVDTDLYARLLGVDAISAYDAALHYAQQGHRDGLTFNVLLDPDVIGRAIIRSWRPLLYDYLNSRAWFARTSAMWDSAAYLETQPESREHPFGPAGHLWEHVTANPDADIDVIAGGARTMPWNEVYTAASDALVAHADAARAKALRLPQKTIAVSTFNPDAARTTGPLVSIIMPVWNRSGAMRTAVDSVIAQQWQDWELLIIDDGSWDDTVHVAQTLADRDPRIVVLTPGHQGVSGARNSGISAARGEYIAFLDSDNTWQPEFLTAMMDALESTRSESGFATIALDREGSRTYRAADADFASLLRGNSIDLNTFIVRRDVLDSVGGGFDTSLVRAVDYDLILKVAKRRQPLHVNVVGAIYDDSDDASDRISNSEALGWNTVVRLSHTPPRASSAETGGADTEVLWFIQPEDAALPEKLLRAVALGDEHQATRFVLMGGHPGAHALVAVAAVARPLVTYDVYDAGEPFAYAVANTLAETTAQRVIVIDPRAVPTTEAIEALRVAVKPGVAVMPLTVSPDGTLESAGAGVSRPGAVPHRLLAEHPELDAPDQPVRVPLLTGRSFGIDVADYRRSGGLDALLFNDFDTEALSVRLAASGVATVLEPSARFWQSGREIAFSRRDTGGNEQVIRAATQEDTISDGAEVYHQAGLDIAGYSDGIVNGQRRPTALATHQGAKTPNPDGSRRRRWAIKIAAPAGPVGETWGDTAFARALARALRSLGQDVVIDPRESVYRRTQYLDDIDIVLRGLDTYKRRTAAPAILWVISHPDDVTRSEARNYDAVFAASVSWSRKMSERWGLDIEPLLQCTDPTVFTPDGQPGHDAPLLFIGNSRWIARSSVMVPIEAGVELDLYGGDWSPFIDESLVRATHIDNNIVAPLYQHASAVLNDHWSDMRREGFISNRLFDVVAAGGRAISDDVEGVADIFGGSVYTYEETSQLRDAVTGDVNTLFPDSVELDHVSERIRSEHSFDARARVLLDTVDRLA